MDIPFEIAVGECIRIELIREHIPALKMEEELENALIVVEFICYDIGNSEYRDLEAYVEINICQTKYFVDIWKVEEKVARDTMALTKVIRELLPKVIESAPWDKVKEDFLKEIEYE